MEDGTRQGREKTKVRREKKKETEIRPGQMSGRVGFGSGQGRVTGRIGRPAPDPYLSPGRVGLARAPCAGVSGRVFFGLGRVFWPLGRVFRVGSGFGSKITARARPVDCCGSKNTARAHPPRSSGRVGSGFFRAGWVGLFGSGDPCPGLVGARGVSPADVVQATASSRPGRVSTAATFKASWRLGSFRPGIRGGGSPVMAGGSGVGWFRPAKCLGTCL